MHSQNILIEQCGASRQEESTQHKKLFEPFLLNINYIGFNVANS